MRVAHYLNEQRIAYETVVHPPAFTAQKRAKYMGVSGKQVAKAVLLAGPEDYFLAVLPATQQIDTAALEKAFAGPVRLAAPHEVARIFRDCEWGVVVPFGTLYGLPCVLEESLDPDATLVFEGPTHAEAIRLRCRDYERLEHPVRLLFGRGQSNHFPPAPAADVLKSRVT